MTRCELQIEIKQLLNTRDWQFLPRRLVRTCCQPSQFATSAKAMASQSSRRTISGPLSFNMFSVVWCLNLKFGIRFRHRLLKSKYSLVHLICVVNRFQRNKDFLTKRLDDVTMLQPQLCYKINPYLWICMDPKGDSMFGEEVHQPFFVSRSFKSLRSTSMSYVFGKVFGSEMFLKPSGGGTKHWSRPQHVMLGAHHMTHSF